MKGFPSIMRRVPAIFSDRGFSVVSTEVDPCLSVVEINLKESPGIKGTAKG